jgi:hypothetical protein
MMLSPAASFADPVVFSFAGTLDVEDLGNLSFGGTYTFDSGALDENGDPDFGDYSALLSLDLTIGSFSFLVPTPSDDYIHIGNSDPDGYIVALDGLSGADSLSLSMFFVDASASVFDSDALPLTAPDLGSFTSVGVAGSFIVGETSYTVSGGELDSLQGGVVVPAPGAAALGAIGLLLVGWMGRRC